MRQEFDNTIFTLSIHDLRIWVHLGCSDEEKFHPQMVSFSIDINFKTLPAGAQTDSLQDTVCYLDLVTIITRQCQEKKFNLVEHLAKSVHEKIAASLSAHIHQLQSITVTLHKISPPVPGVHGGVKWRHHINYSGSL
jgi:dihydroneopterin aldolase